MLGLMGRDELRAGDDDRQAVADRLKDALDQGRLDLHEYDERLQRVYAAKTYGDLEGLTADLPGTIPTERSRLATPQPSAPQPAEPGAPVEPSSRQWVTGYAGVVVVCVLIWALTSLSSGEWRYFWPGWMLIPLVWGAVGHFRGHGR